MAGIAMRKPTKQSGSSAKRAKSARTGVTLIPVGIEALRGEHQFEPFDTKELLTQARELAESRNIAPNDAVNEVLSAKEKDQLGELLRWLQCDASDENCWRSAFVKLARIHHNVGRLVHRRSANTLSARTWTSEEEAILLISVNRLKERGYSEREAIQLLADTRVARDKWVFPHSERRSYERTPKETARSREGALWRKYMRLVSDGRATLSPLSRALAPRFETDLELMLWLLENPMPD
jgi:hypothetical protein